DALPAAGAPPPPPPPPAVDDHDDSYGLVWTSFSSLSIVNGAVRSSQI
ncbi:hypothetical protein Tco_1289369, partial [Tanacetum coccineum]